MFRRPLRDALALAAFIALSLAVAPVAASEPEEPTAGFRAEMLADLGRLQEKLVGLAEEIPAERYDWRPAEGVRSVSEALMHVAASNHRMLQTLGHEAPAEVGDMESITDKAQVVEELKTAIAAVRAAIVSTGDADLDSEVELFGRTWSKRSVLYLVATHMHEHLGQVIAYARSVGVAPPWSRSG